MFHKFKEILHDKNGYLSLREVVSFCSFLVCVVAWVGSQFFNLQVPTDIFLGFLGLVSVGIFGYSLEKKQRNTDHHEQSQQSQN